MARYGVRFENDPSLTPQDLQELGVLAEKLGYETVWAPEGGGRDSLTALAAIALRTERVRLGTGILPIYARTATNTAMGAAGMAAVSGDRFILGLGVGHRPTVEGRDGVPFRQPMARLRETIGIVRGLLSGEDVAYEGRHFNIASASLGGAAPKERVPIYIAALGPQMLELAGEMADGVLMNWTAESFIREAVEHVKHGAEKAGRDPSEIDIAGYVRVAAGGDEDAVRASLRGQVARYASNTFYRNFFVETGFGEEMTEAANCPGRRGPGTRVGGHHAGDAGPTGSGRNAGRVPRRAGTPPLRRSATAGGGPLRHRGQQGVAPADDYGDGAGRLD